MTEGFLSSKYTSLTASLTTTLTRLSSWDSPYLTPLSYARKHLQSNSKIDRKKPLSFQRPSGKRILCTGKRQGIFAIGGHVQYDGAAGGDTTEGDTTSSNAKVAIRWDGYSTLRLPLADDTTQLNTPVTMDADNIWTDFNLAAYGILETINQTLVQSKHSEKRAVAVKAELCKLDVSIQLTNAVSMFANILYRYSLLNQTHLSPLSTIQTWVVRWAHSWFVYRSLTKVDRLPFDMTVNKSSSTGHLSIQKPSNGPLS